MSQLSLGSNELGRATLACFHDPVSVDVRALRRTTSGWYASVPCPECRRRRAVVSIAYPTSSDPTAILPLTD